MSLEKQPAKISLQLPADSRLGERSRQILSLKFDNPDLTNVAIAKIVGVSEQRVGHILRHPRVLQAMPLLARARIKSLVPKAVKAYEQLVSQNENLQVKEKAAGKVLTEGQVFDSPTVKIEGQVNLTLTHVHELREIVEKAHKLSENVIDVDLIDDKSDGK